MVHGNTRRETQFLKVYANHTMLTPSQCTAHLAMFLRTQFISAGQDPKKCTACLNGRKPNSRLQRSKSNWRLFKILRFSGLSLLGMKSSTLQPHFLSGGLLWQMVIIISFAWRHKLHLDWDLNGSKSYQTEW